MRSFSLNSSKRCECRVFSIAQCIIPKKYLALLGQLWRKCYPSAHFHLALLKENVKVDWGLRLENENCLWCDPPSLYWRLWTFLVSANQEIVSFASSQSWSGKAAYPLKEWRYMVWCVYSFIREWTWHDCRVFQKRAFITTPNPIKV